MISFFCLLLTSMSRPSITLDKLNSEDYYRAQVQLPDKMVWAVVYNPIADFNKGLAASLRDKFASDIQGRTLEAARNLVVSNDSFRFFLKNWLKLHVDLSAAGPVREFMKAFSGYAIIDDRSYPELLKDPQWQKMRLLILQRDEWQCRFCHAGHLTLHIHHGNGYKRGLKPWEYPESELFTVCELCHAGLHGKTSFDVEIAA